MSQSKYYMGLAAELYNARLINEQTMKDIQKRALNKYYYGKKIRVK